MNDLNLLEEYKKFANILADESENIIMQYFRQNFQIEQKDDESPVTIADKNSELRIRELIKKEYPNHGVIGEEFETINSDSDFLWVIDPIDGTKSFVSGHKDFGTLIALLFKKKPIIGIINCPAHNERWVGAQNQKTKMNDKIIYTSSKKSISECYSYSSGLYQENTKFKTFCNKVFNKVKNYRLGGDCYAYGMLASGLIDIVIEDTLKIWDYMALIPVIEGAGGVVSDISGKNLDLNSDGSFIAASSKEILAQVLELTN